MTAFASYLIADTPHGFDIKRLFPGVVQLFPNMPDMDGDSTAVFAVALIFPDISVLYSFIALAFLLIWSMLEIG